MEGRGGGADEFCHQDRADTRVEHSIVGRKSFPYSDTGQNFAVLLQVGWHVSPLCYTRSKGLPMAT